MSDLRAREGSSSEWEGEVVELVEDGHTVGVVYRDGETLLSEFVPAVAGEPWAFEVADLQTALDTARAMLMPEGTALLSDRGPALGEDDEHPVDRLATEFDEFAAKRGEEDEGFYPKEVAGRIIAACDVLGLAVVAIEGFRMDIESPTPITGMSVDTGDAHDGEPWPIFMAGCNVQAAAVLERWSREPGLVIALEVADADGDRYVL